MPFTFGIYLVDDGDALKAAMAFDERCLANYDFAGHTVPDDVDVADIGRLIGSRMVGFSMEVAGSLIRAGRGAPWSRVPIDARLQEANPSRPLYEAACDLWDYFDKISGVGDAIATKLLGLKRPALFPVVDDRVATVYAGVVSQFGSRRPTLAAIRADLLRASEKRALGRLRAALLVNGGGKAERLAQLPGIRLRDIVLWQRWQSVGAPPPPGPSLVRW